MRQSAGNLAGVLGFRGIEKAFANDRALYACGFHGPNRLSMVS